VHITLPERDRFSNSISDTIQRMCCIMGVGIVNSIDWYITVYIRHVLSQIQPLVRLDRFQGKQKEEQGWYFLQPHLFLFRIPISHNLWTYICGWSFLHDVPWEICAYVFLLQLCSCNDRCTYFDLLEIVGDHYVFWIYLEIFLNFGIICDWMHHNFFITLIILVFEIVATYVLFYICVCAYGFFSPLY
jgi:hypothetical protein